MKTWDYNQTLQRLVRTYYEQTSENEPNSEPIKHLVDSEFLCPNIFIDGVTNSKKWVDKSVLKLHSLFNTILGVWYKKTELDLSQVAKKSHKQFLKNLAAQILIALVLIFSLFQKRVFALIKKCCCKKKALKVK